MVLFNKPEEEKDVLIKKEKQCVEKLEDIESNLEKYFYNIYSWCETLNLRLVEVNDDHIDEKSIIRHA